MNPAAVSSWHDERKYFKYFMASAERNGITVHNSDSGSWGNSDWRTIAWWRKIEAQRRFVDENPEFTHYMFTDSYDIIFAAGWPEIMEKYERLRSPIVFGTESYCWPNKEQADLYPVGYHRSRFLNAGFWMGTREAVIPFLTEASRIASKHDQCDSTIFVNMFLSGKHPVKLDTACSLMFCTNNNSMGCLDLTGERPQYLETGEFPCIFHGNGNSPLQPIVEALKL